MGYMSELVGSGGPSKLVRPGPVTLQYSSLNGGSEPVVL
jgi:hypothetical protein